MRTPRVTLPSGSVRLVEPDFAGGLSGFTLLFEALILMLSQQMPFAAVSRIVGESAYRGMAVCERYVEIALGLADLLRSCLKWPLGGYSREPSSQLHQSMGTEGRQRSIGPEHGEAHAVLGCHVRPYFGPADAGRPRDFQWRLENAA